jgi:hypothetical protein
VDQNAEVLEVLEEFGIKLDPWTMIALKCTVQSWRSTAPSDTRRNCATRYARLGPVSGLAGCEQA